jgi:5'-nucleotidase
MDVDLAQKTSGIDLIIGGHSHTFLETPESYVNKVGQRVMVTQVGHSGIVLGRIDVTFDDTSRVKAAVAHNSIVGHADWDSLV